ncbi:colicin E5-related ribonuclease [Pseudoalteromonas arabiensis]|uniref:colicin E5-related ribonuclease n=1 Tax=Pseudoalteromonas arabiensis TaxID=874454 RepID=UPI0012EEB4D5
MAKNTVDAISSFNESGESDPASVYGTKDGGHVVVNDNTSEVTHISDKSDPNRILNS